ncbi:MAG: hypothetical protein RIS51_73 [Actinomycetota bacterium]|jgi:proteasome accessory factor B
MAQSKEERLFTLTCALLAAGNLGLTKEQIFQAVPGYAEANAGAGLDKLFERDKTALRDAGVLIETLGIDEFMDEVTDSRYRLPRGSFEWPKKIELTAKKLQLLELAAKAWNAQSMSVAARQGLTRLKALGLVDMETELEVFSPRLLAQHDSFKPLSEAIVNLKLVRFEYKKSDGSKKTRLLKPWKLRNLEGQWVLLGQEVGGQEAKNFLLRRIYSRVEILEESFESPSSAEISKAEESLVAFVNQRVARVQVSEGSEAMFHYQGLQVSTGVIEIHFMDEDLLAEDLLEFGSAVKVLEPKSLAELISKKLREVISAHA